jgi:hypothetical protein
MTQQVNEKVDSFLSAVYHPQPNRRRLALGEVDGMRVITWHMKSVVFVCEDREDNSVVVGRVKRTPVGTAFFVSVPHEHDGDVSFKYLVTARHTIEKTDKDCLYVRMNKKDQGVIDCPTRRDDWRLHERADVAVILAAFAFVTPAEAIRELLTRQDFVEERNENYQEIKSSGKNSILSPLMLHRKLDFMTTNA